MQIDQHVNELLLSPLLRRDLSVAIDDFELQTPSGPISLSATIVYGGDDFDFRLKLRDGKGRDLSRFFPKSQSISSDDFLEATGTVGNKLRVRLTEIRPPHLWDTTLFGPVKASTASALFGRIELPAWGFDRLTSAGASSPDPANNPVERFSDTADSPSDETEYSHIAVFPNTKALFSNTTLTRIGEHPFWGKEQSSNMVSWDGEAFGGRFSLKDYGGNLLIGFYFKTRSPEDAQRRAGAFLAAIGFTHGVNPGPCYLEIREGGRIIEHHLRAVRQPMGNWVPLFGLHGHKYPEAPTEMITSVASWLYGLDETACQNVLSALWVFHSTFHRNIPIPVTLAALGAVIEGLFTSRANTAPPEAFLAFRSDAVAWARAVELESAGTEREDFAKRLAGYLNGWGYLDRRTAWKQVFSPLFPGREVWLDEIYRLYQKHRHAPAHGDFVSSTEGDGGKLIHAIGQLAGFVNLVIAARAGYKGPILESPFADRIIHLR